MATKSRSRKKPATKAGGAQGMTNTAQQKPATKPGRSRSRSGSKALPATKGAGASMLVPITLPSGNTVHMLANEIGPNSDLLSLAWKQATKGSGTAKRSGGRARPSRARSKPATKDAGKAKPQGVATEAATA